MGKQLAINLLRLQNESIRSREDKDDVDGENIGSLRACSSRLPTSTFRRTGSAFQFLQWRPLFGGQERPKPKVPDFFQAVRYIKACSPMHVIEPTEAVHAQER
jgi:hypothetical protein